MQAGFHKLAGRDEVYQVWTDPNIKMWCNSAVAVDTERALAKQRGEDDTIYVQNDIHWFCALGQIAGVVPAGVDPWGVPIA